jgi:hypothetical protein
MANTPSAATGDSKMRRVTLVPITANARCATVSPMARAMTSKT